MSSYTISTTPRQDAGIARAYARYNEDMLNSSVFVLGADNNPTTEKVFKPITPAEYVQFVMGDAATSYANQYGL